MERVECRVEHVLGVMGVIDVFVRTRVPFQRLHITSRAYHAAFI